MVLFVISRYKRLHLFAFVYIVAEVNVISKSIRSTSWLKVTASDDYKMWLYVINLTNQTHGVSKPKHGFTKELPPHNHHRTQMETFTFIHDIALLLTACRTLQLQTTAGAQQKKQHTSERQSRTARSSLVVAP